MCHHFLKTPQTKIGKLSIVKNFPKSFSNKFAVQIAVRKKDIEKMA